MAKQGYIEEIPLLSNSPDVPSAGWVKKYFNTTLKAWLYYDSIRTKWLSIENFVVDVDRVGNIAAGNSLRTGSGIPTSSVPIYLPYNLCLVGAIGSTSSLERFVLRVDDVSGGSNKQTSINYESAGPSSTRNFSILTLNENYNQNDTLDVYILSSNTGTVSDPRIRLIFRIRG